jgi:cobalt-zinc-cadmium efflux system outer membrane protein
MRDATATARASVLVAALAILAACATVDPSPDHEEARLLIRQSTEREEVFDPSAAPMSEADVDAVLQDGLSLDEALRLALLDNRHLQAGFLGLGVARAEFVQAGLLRNPSLGVAFLLPSGGGRPKIAIDVFESIVDLWEIPSRKRLARSELSQQILDLSRFAGELVADTKDAYFRSVAARELRATAGENLELTRQSFVTVQQRVAEGVATTTEESLARNAMLAAELAARRSERDDVVAKRRLASLLSLESDVISVPLTDALPAPALLEFDRETLVARGRESRLDVRAAVSAVLAAEDQLGLEKSRVFPSVELGVSLERPEHGASVDLLAGPAAKLDVPVFDQNQAKVAGARYRVEAMRRELAALLAEVGQDVRAAVDRATSAARTAQFAADELLPQAEQGAALARSSFDLGGVTLPSLLESQRAVLTAREHRIEALLEAALAQVELERAAGGPIAKLASGWPREFR